MSTPLKADEQPWTADKRRAFFRRELAGAAITGTAQVMWMAYR